MVENGFSRSEPTSPKRPQKGILADSTEFGTSVDELNSHTKEQRVFREKREEISLNEDREPNLHNTVL